MGAGTCSTWECNPQSFIWVFLTFLTRGVKKTHTTASFVLFLRVDTALTAVPVFFFFSLKFPTDLNASKRMCGIFLLQLVARPPPPRILSHHVIFHPMGRAFIFCAPVDNLPLPVPLPELPVCWRESGRSEHSLAGCVYHAVCSRRLDKDYTSYTPYSRYTSGWVCACGRAWKCVDVNSCVYFLGVCLVYGVYYQGPLVALLDVVQVEQLVISSEATEGAPWRTSNVHKGVVRPNYQCRRSNVWLCRFIWVQSRAVTKWYCWLRGEKKCPKIVSKRFDFWQNPTISFLLLLKLQFKDFLFQRFKPK